MIPYLIHVSILTAILFLAYRMILSRETFFAANRYILLIGIAATFIIPMISVPSHWSIHDAYPLVATIEESVSPPTYNAHTQHVQPKSVLLSVEEPYEQNLNAQPDIAVPLKENAVVGFGTEVYKTDSFTLWSALDILRTIYTMGLGVFCLLFLTQLMRLAWMYHKGVKRNEAGLHIVENDCNESSFSFWSCVFLSKDAYDEETYRQILDHERIHIQSKHSLDMLIAEIFVIVQWYNPFVWMYKKAIENNLEYLTDKMMLSSGADRQRYQLSLVRVAVPDRQIALSNYYNQSSLKKRIIMMNHKKSSLLRTWKYLLILPLILLSMVVLNGVRAEEQEPMKQLSEAMDPTEEFQSQLATYSNNNLSDERSIEEEPQNTGISKLSALARPSERVKASERVLPLKHIQEYAITQNDTMLPPPPPAPPAPPLAPSQSDLQVPPAPPSAPRPALAPAPNATPVHTAHGADVRPALAAVPAPPAPPSMKAMLVPMAPPAPLAPVVDPIFGDDIKSGNWEAKIKGGQRCITFKIKEEGSKWTWRSCDDGDFLEGIENVAKGPYRFEREAGALILTGEWNGRKGKGTFEFEGSESFQKTVKAKGGTTFSDGALFHCFLNNIGTDYLDMLAQNGIDITGDAVHTLATHGINESELREYANAFKKADLKISNAEDIVAFHMHGVDGEYIADMYQYLGDIDVEEYVQMAIHGVEPAFAGEAYKAFGGSLKTEELIQMSIHGIDLGYIRELKDAGLSDLDTEQIIQYAVHGVEPHYIAALRQSGIKDLNHESILQASIHGVDVDYVNELKDAGFTNMTVEDIVQMSIHGVHPELVQAIISSNIRDKSVEDLVQAEVHGLDADFVEEVLSLGWDDPRLEYLIQLHTHGLDADDLKEARGSAKKGNDLQSVFEYILQNGMNR